MIGKILELLRRLFQRKEYAEKGVMLDAILCRCDVENIYHSYLLPTTIIEEGGYYVVIIEAYTTCRSLTNFYTKAYVKEVGAWFGSTSYIESVERTGMCKYRVVGRSIVNLSGLKPGRYTMEVTTCLHDKCDQDIVEITIEERREERGGLPPRPPRGITPVPY